MKEVSRDSVPWSDRHLSGKVVPDVFPPWFYYRTYILEPVRSNVGIVKEGNSRLRLFLHLLRPNRIVIC